jgi:hypothetical protein
VKDPAIVAPARPVAEEEDLEAVLWAIAGEVKANMQPGTTSDHDWLHDFERKHLVAKVRDFAQTDTEPALKD